MSVQNAIQSFYLKHQVPNPINVTLTEKQLVNGQRIDDLASEQNFRLFRNLLNKHLFGNAYKRYGKQLAMFVVREESASRRHHLHLVIECPEHRHPQLLMELVISCWRKTRFGYDQFHFEAPETDDRKHGWVNYCLKKRTKSDLASSIDWANSTCFERR